MQQNPNSNKLFPFCKPKKWMPKNNRSRSNREWGDRIEWSTDSELCSRQRKLNSPHGHIGESRGGKRLGATELESEHATNVHAGERPSNESANRHGYRHKTNHEKGESNFRRGLFRDRIHEMQNVLCRLDVNSDSKTLRSPSAFSAIMRAKPSQKDVSCARLF
jgi:hypothetical protein